MDCSSAWRCWSSAWMRARIWAPIVFWRSGDGVGEAASCVYAPLYENDNDIGVAFDTYDPDKIGSDPGVRADLFRRPLDEVRITDCFGGVAQVEVLEAPVPGAAAQWDEEKTHRERARPAARTAPRKGKPETAMARGGPRTRNPFPSLPAGAPMVSTVFSRVLGNARPRSLRTFATVKPGPIHRHFAALQWPQLSGRDATNGIAHFLEHITGKRIQHALELETVYYAKSFRKDVPIAVDIISDILQNLKLENAAIEHERDVILREQQEVDKQLEVVVFDHLHSVAFNTNRLAAPSSAPEDAGYIKTDYTANRMILVGTGGIDHTELVKLAEKHFSSLPQPLREAGRAAAEAPQAESTVHPDESFWVRSSAGGNPRGARRRVCWRRRRARVRQHAGREVDEHDPGGARARGGAGGGVARLAEERAPSWRAGREPRTAYRAEWQRAQGANDKASRGAWGAMWWRWRYLALDAVRASAAIVSPPRRRRPAASHPTLLHLFSSPPRISYIGFPLVTP
ncbi:Metalloenzyme, LuxS/M16 peptidase-like protein [Mycena galericulata]|nr:Metalloenzyme, LuxS/M16 peptidase-like protein [Mycena galericulata]